MYISKLVVKNYKLLKDVNLDLNERIAIAVDKFPLKSKFQFNDITISVGSRHISCKKITFN